MSQRRIKIKRAKIRLDQIDLNSPLVPPIDEAMVNLILRARRHEIPVDVQAVPLAEIRVHDQATLGRVRGLLVEEPSVHEAIEQVLRESPLLWVHRHDGKLCQFDDYVQYAVATDIGVEMIAVVILGEGTRFLNVGDDGGFRLGKAR